MRSTRIAWRRHLTAVLCAAVASLAGAAPAFAASETFVRGAGYGHGVGMSQYGAYGYALRGWNYRAILAHYYAGTSLGTVDPRGIVTVLLATGRAAFTGATSTGIQKLKAGSTYEVDAVRDGRLRLVDESGKLVGTFTALTVRGPGPLTVPGLGSYRGALEFRPAGSGRVETINEVGLDDYVRGVVAAEMPSRWSMQALEAQAVAARTYAVTTDAGGSGFEEYSDTRSQVYGGVGAEAPRSDAAVAATRGQVVTYDRRPATTYFFSSSGGYTEDIEDVWPGTAPEPWLRAVGDPYDGVAGNPYHRWDLQLSGARAASKLHHVLDGALVGIAVLAHGASPRITKAEVLGTGGRREVTGSQLERVLGLPSTWATFTTITTVVRQHLSGSPSARAGAAELAMPLSLVRATIAHVAPIPELAGTVFPAPSGAVLSVQEYRGRRWGTVRRPRLGSGGGYSVTAPRRGVYRIVYDGLDGPSVTL